MIAEAAAILSKAAFLKLNMIRVWELSRTTVSGD